MLLASVLSLFYLKESKNVNYCAWSDFFLLTCLFKQSIIFFFSFAFSWKDQFFPNVENSEEQTDYESH